MILTSDGNLLLAGTCNLDVQLALNDVFLIKVTPNGNVLWRKEYKFYGDELISDLIQTKDGGCVMSCSLYRNWSDYASPSYGYILKTDGVGAVVWRRPTSPSLRAADCSLELSNGDLLFGSHSNWPYLIKTDSSGIYKMAKEYNVSLGYKHADRIFTMKKDQKGDISLAGMEWPFLNYDPDAYPMTALFMKINEALDLLSKSTVVITPTVSSYATELIQFPSGKSMIIGQFYGDSIFVSTK